MQKNSGHKHIAVLILGSNQGDRERFLEQAQLEIAQKIGNITVQSSVSESEAFGYDSPNKYVNQALVVETNLESLALLQATQNIENELGRIRSATQRYTDRTIDIDILFYDSELIFSEKLVIPHPHITEREFVLTPLAQIIPHFIHPTTGETINEMLTKVKNILH